MIWIIGIIIGALPCGVGYIIYKNEDRDIMQRYSNNKGWFSIGIFIMIVTTTMLLLVTAFGYSNQLSDKFAVQKTYEVEAINKDKVETLNYTVC